MSINRISGHQRNIEVISAYRRVHKQVLTALCLAKWRFESTDPHCSVTLSKEIFLLICKLKTNFIAKSQLVCMGCQLS